MMTTACMVRLAHPHLPNPWYSEAHSVLVSEFGLLSGYVADLLALFSPRITVRRSVRQTLNYLRTGTFLLDCTIHIQAEVQNYEATSIIRGPKTSAFARNLRGDYYPVALDVWMARLLGVPQRSFQPPLISTFLPLNAKPLSGITSTPCPTPTSGPHHSLVSSPTNLGAPHAQCTGSHHPYHVL